VTSALSISGVFDLEPLRHAPFLKDDLRLTAAAVRKLSPVGFPAPRGRLVAAVGAEESDEFVRQNALIQQAWGRQAVPVAETIPGVHHLNILHDFVDPQARLHQMAQDLLDASAH